MRYPFLLCILLSAFHGFAQEAFEPIQRADQYRVFLDLTAAENDALPVQMVVPICEADSIEFHIPRIIPGTYDVNNYGRFISAVKAFAADGEKLQVKQLDQNRWQIADAKRLYKISYKVDDTYDYPGGANIFEPGGTSIKKDTVFLLNNFGFVGYLKGRKKHPFELSVKKPEGFYGSTALVAEREGELDVYTASDYFEVHDSPMLYCKPDTASMQVGNARVLVSVFSQLGLVSADTALQNIAEVLRAAANYLGGALPVDKYAVLIYCEDPSKMGTSYGALEHHKSTLLYMPEVAGERFYSGVRDITSHEFFHIITPLSIHSEQIHNFNFINPEMSEHIWLYEGVTEYNSILVQVRDGIISPREFLAQMRAKMVEADGFNQEVPLTIASTFTLSFLKDQYYNFYQKGALAGMALDLKLRSLSEGAYGLPDLLDELGQVYGQDTFFVDEKLFDIITEMTYPEMREFFALHFEGAVPFDYARLLKRAGVTYLAEEPFERLSYGNIGFSYSFDTGRLVVEDVSEMDAFGEDMGYQKGDEIVEFNGRPLDLTNLEEVMGDFFENTEPGDKVAIVVARPTGNENDFKNKKLKARAALTVQVEEHVLRLDEAVEPQVERMRKKWINQ